MSLTRKVELQLPRIPMKKSIKQIQQMQAYKTKTANKSAPKKSTKKSTKTAPSTLYVNTELEAIAVSVMLSVALVIALVSAPLVPAMCITGLVAASFLIASIHR
jgi:hypothetical protein